MPYSLGSRDRFTQTSSRYTLRKDFHLQLHINSYKNNLTLHKNVLLATFKVINCCNSKVAEVLKQKNKTTHTHKKANCDKSMHYFSGQYPLPN